MDGGWEGALTMQLNGIELSLPYLPPSLRTCYTNDHHFHSQDRGSRTSVSESNVLLDPEVLPDLSTQALVLTVLATLVKYSTDETETRFLYQYLAEGSVVFPKVFPVM